MVTLNPSYICLYVADVSRSVDFYQRVLQLKQLPEQSTKHFTAFQFGPLILGIEPNGSASDGEKTKEQNATLLQFTVDSLEALEEATAFLEQEQVRIIDRVRTYSFATLTSFLDPDGNRLEILYQ
jgi:catechol 2,3-dioxygenase-like lactoylglutathione lyase family enzyme